MTHRQARFGWLAVPAAVLLALTGCAAGSEEPATEEVSTAASGSGSPLTGSFSEGTQGAPTGDASKVIAPDVPKCPYVEEVFAAAPGERFATALELGCEYDLHGAIEFSEPTPGSEHAVLISEEHAMSLEELLDAGVISEEEYERYLPQLEGK